MIRPNWTTIAVEMNTLLLLALAATLVQAPAFPQADIGNGRIQARLYLPDAEAGYYRATRFDWSGVIASLEWNGHRYFGQWFARHNPKTNDAITGPVEEFMTSPGYDEAGPEGVFVRIGVGAVRKPAEPAYRRFATYDIVDAGTWVTNRSSDRVQFIHTLADTNGYAYVYVKTVRLASDTLVLEHDLRNTGPKPIVTSVYNHNFFVLDGQPTGPDTVVRLPFTPQLAAPPAGLVEARGNDIVYLQELQPRQSVLTEITGFGPNAGDYDIRVENRRTGAGVRITSDRPLSKLLLWSPRTTVCPEPYIDLNIAPGQEASWRTTYEFYEAPKTAGIPPETR